MYVDTLVVSRCTFVCVCFGVCVCVFVERQHVNTLKPYVCVCVWVSVTNPDTIMESGFSLVCRVGLVQCSLAD